MAPKALIFVALLALATCAAPVAAGGVAFLNKADFLLLVPGLFYDVVFPEFAEYVDDVGSTINSIVYPDSLDSDAVPLVGAYITGRTLGSAPSQLVGYEGFFYTQSPMGLTGLSLGTSTQAAAVYFDVPPNGDVGDSPDFVNLQLLIRSANGDLYIPIEVNQPSQFVGYLTNSPSFYGVYARLFGYRFEDELAERDADEVLASYYAPAAINHVLVEAQYLSTGGDPHIKSASIDAILPNLAANDHINLVAHPHVLVNARLRSFDFLPEDVTYYGAVAVRIVNGDLILVEAYEEAESGEPAYRVTVNGEALALHTSASMADSETAHGYELHYETYGNVPHAQTVSVFHRDYPYMEHNAAVHVLLPGVLAIDIDLASKDAFVDWHQATPVVTRQPGAFLNMAVRDLVQNSRSETTGLLKVTDRLQRAKMAVEQTACLDLEAGDHESHARSLEASDRLATMLAEVVDKHLVHGLF